MWPSLVPQRRERLNGLTVLAVEDHDQTREWLVGYLESAGMTVFPARCVSEAISLFDERTPGIIISDLGLPDGDGCGLIRTLRARGIASDACVPALAMSAFFRPQGQADALSAGFDACLPKHDFDRLLDVMEGLLPR